MTHPEAGAAKEKTTLFPRPAPENERSVGAAKSKGIRKRKLHRRFPSMIRNVVQIAFGIGILEINRRRQNLVVKGENADPSFEATRTAKQMTGHGFRGTDGNLFSAIAEDALQRARFDHVTDRSGRAVRIHVADIARRKLRVL